MAFLQEKNSVGLGDQRYGIDNFHFGGSDQNRPL